MSQDPLNVHVAPSDGVRTAQQWPANTRTHNTNKKMDVQASHSNTQRRRIKSTHTHAHIIADTLHPVALSNHRASVYPCVLVSVQSPRWAHGSPVNAKPSVCMCLDHILITAVRSIAQRGS